MTNNTNHLDPIFDLADARNTTAGHMVMTYDSSDIELGNVLRTAGGVDVITDSVIDDLLEELEM